MANSRKASPTALRAIDGGDTAAAITAMPAARPGAAQPRTDALKIELGWARPSPSLPARARQLPDLPTPPDRHAHSTRHAHGLWVAMGDARSPRSSNTSTVKALRPFNGGHSLRHHRQDRRPSRPDQGQDQAQHAAHPTSPGPRPHDGQATSRPMTVQPYPRFAGPTSDPLRAPQSDTGTQTAPQSPTQAADGQHSAAESRSRAARRQRDEQAYLFSPLEG